jgi:hypothetical protein
MQTLNVFFSEAEARAELAYRAVYYAEYMRVYEPGRADDRVRLLFWSDLAHRAAASARDRTLAEAAPAEDEPIAA